MGRRSRKSKRKLNSLFMMLLLTTAMLVVSTYAWFSANREVQITGITAKVAAAEGLLISIDGSRWNSSVTVNADTLKAVSAYNTYQWPEELEPVSTDGTVDGSDIHFLKGDVSTDGTKLTGVAPMSSRTAAVEETDPDSGEVISTTFPNAKFIAFDVYLKNSSSKAKDELDLSAGSRVAINTTEGGKENTGLENSVRVGFLLYGSTAAVTASQGDITGLAVGTPKASIWEPNHNKHIQEIVTNDTRIDALTFPWNTFGLTQQCGSTVEGVNGSAANTYMAAPKTIKTAGDVGAVEKLYTVDDTNNTNMLELDGNKVSRMRVYIWLEGQDPDCVDTASTGRAFDVLINLEKPSSRPATPATSVTTP